MTDKLICNHCGHKGSDVVRRLKYVGGRGYEEFIICENETQCWDRWDKKHNFNPVLVKAVLSV